MGAELSVDSISDPIDIPPKEEGDVPINSYVEETKENSVEIKITCVADTKDNVSQEIPVSQRPSFLFYSKEKQNFYIIPFSQDIDSSWQFVKTLQ